MEMIDHFDGRKKSILKTAAKWGKSRQKNFNYKSDYIFLAEEYWRKNARKMFMAFIPPRLPNFVNT